MSNRKSPLRDRLLSNSPDPIKSSILRESGMGWNPQAAASISSPSSAGSVTSPLRIAKRDSPARPKGGAVARRSSSSYKHMHTNNLVSKSPFKSQIPTPATPSTRPTPIAITFPSATPTRRVSGEKRPRPASMHDQAETENERPFALKRERKQSKVLEGLMEKEPVSKSPFKVGHRRANTEGTKSPSVPVVIPRARSQSYLPDTTTSHISPPTRPSPGPSPGRSALVSKRMHGPRLSGSGRRERRKTVTFDERCDVVEFDRDDEETEEEVFQSADEDEDDGSEGSDEYEEEDIKIPSLPMDEVDADEIDMEQDESYESVALSDEDKKNDPLMTLDPDASITGIVETMFFSPNAHGFIDTSMTSLTSTPPRHSDLPTDLETEDGVPFGRSHHVERFLQHQQHTSPHLNQAPHFSPHRSPHNSPHTHSPGIYPFNLNLPTHASPNGPPATPPRRSPGMMHSTPPLGRSTHVQRIKAAREEEREETGHDIAQLPPSPTPIEHSGKHEGAEEGLLPRFELDNSVNIPLEKDMNSNIGADPFEHSRIQDEPAPVEMDSQDSLEDRRSSNVSIGSSEVNLSNLGRLDASLQNEYSYHDTETADDDENGSNASTEKGTGKGSPMDLASSTSLPAPAGSPLTRATSPLVRGSSPLTRVSSPLLNATHNATINGSGGRLRINKEDVKRRLLGRRSLCSPSPEPNTFDRPASNPGSPRIEVDVASIPQATLTATQDDERDRDRLSIMTGMTDISTETAIVSEAERVNISVGALVSREASGETEFGLLGAGERLKFDFGSKFGLGGLGFPSDDNFGATDAVRGRVSPYAKSKSVSPPARTGYTERTGMRMGDKDVDMEMKSALDRLMEDVAGGPVDDSLMTDESFQSSDSRASDFSLPEPTTSTSRPKVLERASTDTALLHAAPGGLLSRTASDSSTSTVPPPVPPKDSIKNREQLILEKRRQMRRLEEGYEDEDRTSHLPVAQKTQQHLGVGRPSRRRSMSTGDADVLSKRRGQGLLDIEPMEADSLLGRIEEELSKKIEEPKKTRYHVREHENTIYASSSDDKVSHMAGPGDMNGGRAWRTVRRPSDMNEYAKQIREYRTQEKGKAYGKVFVRVLKIKSMHIPMPREPTVVTCTLNNGIHFVTTPECQLAESADIEQEFELIEHSKLEFTLSIKVRRDPHIVAQFKALSAPAPPPSAPVPRPAPIPLVQTTSRSGMLSFFSSSPKKSKEKIHAHPVPVVAPPPPVQQQRRLPENLARYLKPDGTLARAFVSFKDVLNRCDTRLFETSYPLIGQRAELGGKFSTQQVGEIVIQMFRLPPLPGVPQDQLPQSLEECHRGLRHINWHKVTYFQGTLTQSGGDCSTWRRRQFRVVGGNLVAFNDVTKKATATIDLKKATALVDNQESSESNRYEGYGVERSFRLLFPQDDEIIFFADTDEEKSRWLEVLRALVGHIPPHPLWAELLWQRQEEITKRAQAARQVARPYDPSSSTQSQQR